MGKQRVTPKPVAKESPASPLLHLILTELGAAQDNWSLLAKRIQQGYSLAYKRHDEALQKYEKLSKAGRIFRQKLNEMIYFIYASVTVGYAGGAVAAVMTPWVRNAQEVAVRSAFTEGMVKFVQRESAKGSAQELVKQSLKKIIGELEKAENSRDGTPYSPINADPKDFNLDLDAVVLDLFVAVQEPVVAIIDRANELQSPAEVGHRILQEFRAGCPLLADAPSASSMPAVEDVASAAEIAMWVAWAKALVGGTWGLWTPDYSYFEGPPPDNSSDASDYNWAYIHASYFDPILARLQDLKVVPSMTIRARDLDDDEHMVLDVRRLAELRVDGPTMPFRNLPNVVSMWNTSTPGARAKYLSTYLTSKPAVTKAK